MRFLAKNPGSPILREGLTYITGNSENNRILRERIRTEEQFGYCAYTETKITLDECDLDHLDRRIKGKDNYLNYYVVSVAAHRRKTKSEKRFENPTFLEDKFFQKPGEFSNRIQFLDGIFQPIDVNDTEAQNFIDFLDINHADLVEDRNNHLNRIREIYIKEAGYNTAQLLGVFQKFPGECKYISAIENDFAINLSEMLG